MLLKSVHALTYKSTLLALALYGLSTLAGAQNVATSMPATASGLSSAQIDELVEKTRQAFNVPGISVAVVKDNQIVHSKGYGLRSIASKQAMDEHTLVGIASNSKAFTAAALAILVDEKKLDWNDKVTKYIPEFKMYNPYVTEEFTVLDLLTHRSGLGLGAGDLMFFPDGSDFTINDVIYNLRFLKPVSSFRSKYDYDNNLYIVAGEVVKRASGLSWEEFVEKRLLKPLGMGESAAAIDRVTVADNMVDPHVEVDGKLKIVPFKPNPVLGAAAGIYSNVHDMSKWVSMLLNQGTYPGSKEPQRLLSEKVLQQMWSPQTIIPTGPNSGRYNTHFNSYGIGWVVNDVKGYKQVSHTGGLLGMVTQVSLIPELKLGIVVLTNQEQGGAFTAITNTIKDAYLGLPAIDHVKEITERVAKRKAEADKVESEIWQKVQVQLKQNRQPDLSPFLGQYRDNWFGEVSVSQQNGKLRLVSKRSPAISGEMFYYKGTTFVVKWDDRSLHADAFANFSLNHEGKANGMTMKAISPATDFSFDFHDLEFKALP